MSTVIVTRPARKAGPALPEGQVELQEPPVLPEVQPTDTSSLLMYLPMGLGSGAMVLMFANPGSGPLAYIAAGLMGVSSLGMLLAQLTRGAGERKRRLKGERRDYLRYLAQVRKQARTSMTEQRRALDWDHPGPERLRTIALSTRLWERRCGDEDFAQVRLGLGTQRSVLQLLPPQTKPVEDLEPLCASALRRFIRAHSVVGEVPVAVNLLAFARLECCGPAAGVRALLRAVLAQLAAWHAPEDVRIALLAADGVAGQWQWLKWLPHNAHPADNDAAGAVRLFAGEHGGLLGVLGSLVADRPGFDPGATPSSAEPLVVVVADGVAVPGESPLARGSRNVVLLEVGPEEPAAADQLAEPHRMVVRVAAEQVELVVDGTTMRLGQPDQLSQAAADRLARLLSPCRTGGALSGAEPLGSDFDLTHLLGIRDPHHYDVHALWRGRARWGALRVPIGLGEDGSVVELDIKESAQGGMGPHGMLIGATGSGKSELLRTLVIALAATHSSESLNFVLVDFKGGATFLGLDRLPHTSAVITNLADDLDLVDRMQESLHGELIRRQELLRAKGHGSLLEYEKARAAGAALDPLPTLFIVVDEFSELLSSKPEFMDLFVMIGRLGRSLGVHLLLASQRLDEGRIHQVESHLSYRIALRTFSGMESRSIIGVTDAYELPSAPGNGFLKSGNTALMRFKAGYVSGPAPAPRVAPTSEQRVSSQDLVTFELGYRAPVAPVQVVLPEAEPAQPEEERESLLSVLAGRLTGQGPPARQVWLPPLAEPPSLDALLPGVVPDSARGMAAVNWPRCGALQVPLGVVDRPFEQRRDLLLADLSAAAGHVGIVGGPQTGKSTLVKTLLLALALTHTPREVQFYCLDFGGGGLAGLAALPHVGSVVSRLDRDRVIRTVAELTALLQHRELAFAEHGVDGMAGYRKLRGDGAVSDEFGDVFLVIDGWFTLRQDFEDLETAISELAAKGLSHGLHVVVTGSRWSEIRPWLRDMLGSRFELKLGDPLESEVGSRQAGGVPALPGRGLTRDGRHFLVAVPRLDGVSSAEGAAERARELAGEIAEYWSGPTAPAVRTLPTEVLATDLPAPEGDLRVAIGIDEHRLAPLCHDFGQQPHLMVFGDSEVGKTNLLHLLARAVRQRYSPAEARIALADPRRDLHTAVPEEYRLSYAVTNDALAQLAVNLERSLRKRMPGPEITPDRLARRDWWHGPEVFVLVDDYDLFSTGLGGALEPLVPLLAQGAEIGFHLVVARSSSSGLRAMMDPVLRRLWELGCPGLLFACPKEEGKFLGEAPPRQLPPGRAQLVTRRGVQLVQTALVPGADR